MRGGLLCQAGRSNDLHKAHPIKGVGGEVEDHSKASGLDLRQPQGAQVGDLVNCAPKVGHKKTRKCFTVQQRFKRYVLPLS